MEKRIAEHLVATDIEYVVIEGVITPVYICREVEADKFEAARPVEPTETLYVESEYSPWVKRGAMFGTAVVSLLYVAPSGLEWVTIQTARAGVAANGMADNLWALTAGAVRVIGAVGLLVLMPACLVWLLVRWTKAGTVEAGQGPKEQDQGSKTERPNITININSHN